VRTGAGASWTRRSSSSNTNLKLGLTGTTYVMTAILAVVLIFQFRLRRYVPGVYWLAVVLISIVGTLITTSRT
jgi:uncharacterized membrane-anchored protein